MSNDRKPVGRLQVSDNLLAALTHFSTNRYDCGNPHLFVYTTKRHVQQSWTVEEACRGALSLLKQEDMAVLKFEQLRRGLKEYGAEHLYARIMGEPIEAGKLT